MGKKVKLFYSGLVEEPEVTTVSAKGQVVIPRTIREKLG
jgi:hypothetical protein